MAPLRVWYVPLRRLLTAASALAVAAGLSALPAQPAAAATRFPADSLTANVAPEVPSRLSVAGVACTGDVGYVPSATPELRATVDDVDFAGNPSERLTATFAYWPVDRPAERVEWTSHEVFTDSDIRYLLPAALAHEGTYEFAVRATDRAGATSAWTPGCRFTVDNVRPMAPTITSTDYLLGSWAGGPGIPGTFTFTVAPGDTDVQFFRWSVHGVSDNVPVGPDGTATLRYAPTTSGRITMSVAAYDRALNRSDTVNYSFLVQRTDPNAEDRNPAGGLNEPRTIVLSPGMPDVVEYTYWLNDGPHTTVPAGADGTTTITVTPDRVGENHLYATTRTSTDLPSGQLDYWIHVRTAPTLTSPDFPSDGSGEPPLVGEQVTLRFHPGMPGVTEYVWRINRHGQQVTPAGPDGTATVTWTERDRDLLSIEVSSRTADGLESEPNHYDFSLTSHAPAVESVDYPEWTTAGGPGIAGTFTFRPAQEGVTSYTWRLDDGAEQTLPATADGTATLPWTPTAEQTGWHTLTVREHIGDIASNPTEYTFAVAEPESR